MFLLKSQIAIISLTVSGVFWVTEAIVFGLGKTLIAAGQLSENWVKVINSITPYANPLSPYMIFASLGLAAILFILINRYLNIKYKEELQNTGNLAEKEG